MNAPSNEHTACTYLSRVSFLHRLCGHLNKIKVPSGSALWQIEETRFLATCARTNLLFCGELRRECVGIQLGLIQADEGSPLPRQTAARCVGRPGEDDSKPDRARTQLQFTGGKSAHLLGLCSCKWITLISNISHWQFTQWRRSEAITWCS